MKRWIILPITGLPSIPCEWHSAHLENDMALVGTVNLDNNQIASLASTPNVLVLPPIHSSAAVGKLVSEILAKYGVLETDTTYDTLEKVIAVCGLHQIGLGET